MFSKGTILFLIHTLLGKINYMNTVRLSCAEKHFVTVVNLR